MLKGENQFIHKIKRKPAKTMKEKRNDKKDKKANK